MIVHEEGNEYLIGVNSSSSKIGKIIRKIRKSMFNHAFILIKKPNGDLQIYESDVNGVKDDVDFYEKYINSDDNIELWNVDLDEDKIPLAIDELNKIIGQDYGFWQVIGMLRVTLLSRWLKKKVKNLYSANTICSEIPHIFLGICGDKSSEAVRNVLSFDQNSIAPDDLSTIFATSQGCSLRGMKDPESREIYWV